MTIAVFGATGATGKHLVDQSLEKGYKVKALVRDPQKLASSNKNLTVILGNVLDKNDVEETIKDTDIVICVLGSKPGEKRLILREGTANIIAAMKKLRVRRLIVQSSYAMSGDTSGMGIVMKFVVMIMQLTLGTMIQDKKEQEKLVRGSELDWTIVRPVTLTNGAYSGRYQSGEKINVGITNKISRADVANHIVKILTDIKTFRKILIVSD